MIMKKFTFLVLSAFACLSINAQVETVTFTEVEKIDADKMVGSFVFKAASDRYFEVDANAAYFYDGDLANATIENSTKYEYRLKSVGKTHSEGRYILLNATGEGILKIAARTGSNSATDRNVTVTQGVASLFDEIMLEADAVRVSNPTDADPSATSNVYPYQVINIPAAGEVTISFPIGTINLYAVIWEPAAGSSVEDATADKGEVVSVSYYDLTGKQVAADAKGLVIKKVTYSDGSVDAEKVIVK